MESEKQIKSHIQMPKCVLKNFLNENGSLFCYDFQQKGIHLTSAKSFNTEIGYYSQVGESYLSQYIETPLGKLIQFVKEAPWGIKSIPVPPLLNETAKNYLLALMLRSKSALNGLCKTSTFSQFIPIQQLHDLVVLLGFNISKFEEIFSDCFITIAVNDTKIPFVLPIMGAYGLNNPLGRQIYLPLTPKHAIVFIENKKHNCFIENGTCKVLHFLEDDMIHLLNEIAFQQEASENRRGIVSNSRQVIENILKRHPI